MGWKIFHVLRVLYDCKYNRYVMWKHIKSTGKDRKCL